MRNIIALFFVAAAVFAVGERNSWWSVDRQTTASTLKVSSDNFIVLSDDKEANDRLVAQRQQCGDMKFALAELRSLVDAHDDGTLSALDYEELAARAVNELSYQGIIPAGCYQPDLKGWSAIVSTEGDFIVGLKREAVTAYADIVRAEQWKSTMDQLRGMAKTETRG